MIVCLFSPLSVLCCAVCDDDRLKKMKQRASILADLEKQHAELVER